MCMCQWIYICVFPMAGVLNHWELVKHILLRISAKIINITAKTALSFYPVSSIFCNKYCLLSCDLFFCHLLCGLANSLNTTGYQKYASDNVELLQRERRKCIRLSMKTTRFIMIQVALCKWKTASEGKD